MKPAFQKFFLVCFLFGVSITGYTETIRCTITGTIVNRSSKRLLLVKLTEDIRVNAQPIEIVDNKFRFTFTANTVEAYELVFAEEYEDGQYRPIYFFPSNAEINFTLYPYAEFNKDKVEGGVENKEYYDFQKAVGNKFDSRLQALDKKRTILSNANENESPDYQNLMTAIRNAKNQDELVPLYAKQNELINTGKKLTEKGSTIQRSFDSINNERNIFTYEYIKGNPSIVSYYFVWRDISAGKSNRSVADNIQNVYPILAAKYPDHPYTIKIGSELSGLIKIRTGEKYIDFTAPDLSGKNHMLSELANGKITLVDFWGSWCGPCIAKSKTMVAVYNEFKSKAFTVVGVAREFKTKDNLVDALKNNKFPWINLIELDDQQNIWNKYAIRNAAGMFLLLDKDGKILAVDPTAEEVRKELMSKL